MPTDDRIRELRNEACRRYLYDDVELIQAVDDVIREALREQRAEDARVCETEWATECERLYGLECAAAIRGNASAESEDARDAARYRWLRPRFHAVDFEYGDSSEGTTPSIVFAVPADARWSADLDASIDAARGKQG